VASPIFNPKKPVQARTSYAEVVGKGVLTNGVFGSSKKGTGVVGESETYIGVSGDGPFIGVNGTSEDGTGVLGESGGQDGIGVHGKGHKLAGLFEGNVEVTGSLTVQKQNLSDLILKLTTRVATLEATASNVTNGGIPVHLPTLRPVIEVTALRPHAFDLTGSGFSSFGRIKFKVFNLTTQNSVEIAGESQDENVVSNLFADKDGGLVVHEQIQCNSSDVLMFSAHDGRKDPNDLTGILWSNTDTEVVS
jgi:hypothetical protein